MPRRWPQKIVSLPRRAFGRAVGQLRQMRRPGSVVMLHQHRCGSTVVGGMLGRHPGICWRNEVITFNMLQYESAHGSVDGWTCDPARIIRRRRREGPDGWFGCEITHANVLRLGLTMEAMVDRLASLGFTRFIVLERRHHLRRYVSSRAGDQSGKLHRNQGDRAERVRVLIDPARTGLTRESGDLLELLRRDADLVRQTLRLTEPFDPLHLVYEDDIQSDPNVAYHKACTHIGVEPVDAQPRTIRTNPFPLSELIENYDEVSRELAGTEFEWMLDG